MEPFRTREIETEMPEIKNPPVETRNVVSGVEDEAVGENFEESQESELEKWEIQNGKYGLEYLGIKEISKEFPLKAQFGILDNYIKSELKERGYDQTPTSWQDILKELETEIGSEKLNVYERLKKLSSLVNIIKKQKELKKKRELYKSLTG
jgi:hypothetical protein